MKVGGMAVKGFWDGEEEDDIGFGDPCWKARCRIGGSDG